jgi:hypothetical protein
MADRTTVSLATEWLLEGVLLLAAAAAGSQVVAMWRRTVTHVMRYPGPVAVVAYWSLQAMRIPPALVLVTIIAAATGITALVAVAVTLALLVQMVAICTLAIALPRVALLLPRRRDSAQPG